MQPDVYLNSELILNYYEVMTKALKQVQSSELSRNAAHVFGQAEQGPVLVTRRDGVNLVLMSEATHQDREDMAQLVNWVVSASLGSERDFVSRLVDQFPWMLALAEDSRAICAEEIVAALRTSLSTGEPYLALSTFESWKETATAISAGLKGADDWLDEPIRVERP
jgi:hypothetical protein